MNANDSHRKTCRHCGDALSVHDLEGLCSRCVARISLLEPVPDSSLLTDHASIPLTTFGDYELLDEIARGGMGVVYRAHQVSLDRVVAVKMLLLGQFAAPTVFQRFRAEAVAAASLQHPNIVAIHEVGTHDGQPFFAMDYVVGRNLADLVRDRPLPARAAAQYLGKIARAVQYAHEHGILHRDLKPANILIDESDEPRITDFGLAKKLETEAGSQITEVGSGIRPPSSVTPDLTLSGQILGSPNFLPPEQAGGHARTIGPACDIYGLGAVLYYLLTARPPFVAETFESTLFHVLNSEPVPLRQLNPSVPRDLETICLKCLEKDPARRCATAAELADELDRFLNGEPIHARPIGQIGRTWRWCRRKPVVATLMATVATLLLAVTAVSVISAWRIATARKGEQRATYYDHIALASKLIEEGSIDRALETLYKCPEQYRHWEWGHLLYLCHQEAASFQAHTTNVVAVVFSPDGRWVHSQDAAGVAKVWDWEAEREVFAFGSTSNRAGWISFDPQGQHLAAAMGTNGVSVWATTNWQELLTMRPPGGEVTTLAYSPDGRQLAAGGADGTVTVWETASGQRLKELATTNQPLRRVAISPDGQRLVAVADRAAWVWELPSGKVVRTFPDERLLSTSSPVAVFADDTGEHFATIDSKDRLTLWHDGAAPQHLITVHGRIPHPLRRVFFSPDGRWMANAGDQNTARVWEVATGTERLAIGERVVGVAFTRDGTRMATRHNEYWVTTWDLTQGQRLKDLRGHSTYVSAMDLSPDGRLAVSGEANGIIKVWSAGPGRELAQDRAWQWVCTYSPDGRFIANCPLHEGVIIRSVRSGRELLRIHPLNESFFDVAFSPDGRRLATVGTQKTAKVWDVETGELVLRLRGHHRQTAFGVAYSPDGRWIAAGSLDGTAKVWDAHTGQELLTLPMDPQQGYARLRVSNRVIWVSFDANSERLVTGSGDGMVRIWEVASGKLLTKSAAGQKDCAALARFLPDQKRLITAAGNRIRLLDAQTGALITEAQGRGYIVGLNITSDGRRMIATCSNALDNGEFGRGTLEIWDIEGTPRRILTLNGSTLFNWAVFSPDDRTVAGCSFDYCTYRWETFPWREADYAEAGGHRSEVSDQRSEARDQNDLSTRVRAYARHYWRDRLQAELNGVEGEPTESRLIQPVLDRILFSKRDPRAAASQIDLTDSYTGELGETFYGKVGAVFDHDDDLSELPTGLVTMGGVEFDIRGVVQVRRAEPLGEAWEMAASDDPVRVDAIPIQQETARLHLLLGTIQPEADGTVIGTLVLHYPDGETSPLDLVYGRDVREWWYDPIKGDGGPIDRAKVVWTGINPVAREGGRRLRLYLNTRENPRPGVKITFFDFVSWMSTSAPFLIAVTVE